MAFFKSFQESLSSVSVSSILDSVSSTVSNTVDGVRTAVSDVTYTVSDQLTEQVNTIRNKNQGEDEDKGKRDEGEASSEKDSGAGGRINSKRHAYADEEEERRETEKQEQERRNEEEQWEWCYAPSKGWYRKRRDPNQRDTSADSPGERQENKEERTGVSGHPSSSNGDKNLQEAVRMENNEGGQEDTISKTSAETVYCEDTGTEQCPNSNNDQTKGHTQEGHEQDRAVQDEHAKNRDETQSDERKNSMSAKPKQNTGGGTVESSGVERQLSEDGDSEEGSSRSRGSSVLKDQQKEDKAMGSQGQLEVTEVSGDRKDPERSFNKDRFRRCTLL